MSGDWLEDPEVRAWAQSALDDLLPKLRDSALTISLVPDEGSLTDIKFAVELGLSIMLDEPIIAVVRPGTKVPDHLVRVADEIIEGLDDPERVRAAIARVMGDES